MSTQNAEESTQRYGYVFSLLCDDRPGIVAGVSSAINSIGGNIEACSQTVLNRYFTIIMTVTLDRSWDCEELGEKILAEGRLKGCQVSVRPAVIYPEGRVENRPDTFVITAFGRDRNGIVSAFSRYLAEKDVNIIDLYGNRTGKEEFLLISQVEVDARHDIQNLQLDLEGIGSELGFTVKLQHNNVFVATNRLRLEH